MQNTAKTEPCQCALTSLLGMGSVGGPVRENAEHRMFPHEISVAHVFHKKIIFAGVEKLTEKIVQTHRKIPKKAQSCAAWLLITAVSSLAFIVEAASAHTSKREFCTVWAGAVP